MQNSFSIYNSLSRSKEEFKPCIRHLSGCTSAGPTVYIMLIWVMPGRQIILILLYRDLMHLGYKVRYVRNITMSVIWRWKYWQGEDRIERKPDMNILSRWRSCKNHEYLPQEQDRLILSAINRAQGKRAYNRTAGIIKTLLKGLCLWSKRIVYFDVVKYMQNINTVSFRPDSEELMANTRTLEGRMKKEIPLILPSGKRLLLSILWTGLPPWSSVSGLASWGSVMSIKLSGDVFFDIHGGEWTSNSLIRMWDCASTAALERICPLLIHNNMITITSEDGKILGNFITLDDL